MAKISSKRDDVTAYAEAVTSGKIIAGKAVRTACKRHLDDMQHAHERGLKFDYSKAERVFKFFEEFLVLAEGEHAGKKFTLESFQKFILGSLFGWFGADGFRRFRTAYIEIGKGNGKSPLAAGIGLYGLLADGEASAEIYSAAVTRDQAKILFRDAEKMVEASPYLSTRTDKTVNNIANMQSGSFFRPVSSEGRGLDGKRVHIALIDEIHEHPSAVVVDKIRAGTKGRRNPLIFEITNSGYDRNSVCWQHHDYSVKVIDGTLPNDSWFAYVCQLDEGDDWTDEKVWIKANPNLDVSITRKYLREQVAEALGMPSKQNIVKRLNMCVWTEQCQRWLDMDKWDACAEKITESHLLGRPCYAGLDLASTIDIAALELVFPGDDGEPSDVISRFWVPSDGIAKRALKDRVPYDFWERQGLIKATEGDVIDYDQIREDIRELGERFNIREIAYDRWGATQIATQLEGDGFTMVAFGQGFASMSAPTKELEKLVLGRQIAHGGHPVLRWMASNVAIRQDPAGNVKPDKARSTEKIDGIVALIMAIDRATRHSGSSESIYEKEGVMVL